MHLIRVIYEFYISIENTRLKPHLLRFKAQSLSSSNMFIYFIRTLYVLPKGEMHIFLWVGNQFWSIAIHFGPFFYIRKKKSASLFTSCLEAFLEFPNFNKLKEPFNLLWAVYKKKSFSWFDWLVCCLVPFFKFFFWDWTIY